MSLPLNETRFLSDPTGIHMETHHINSESHFRQRPVTSPTRPLSPIGGISSPVKLGRAPHPVTPVVERKLRPRPVPRTPFSSPQKSVRVSYGSPLRSKNTKSGMNPKDEKVERRLTDRSCAPSPPAAVVIKGNHEKHEVNLGIEVLAGKEMKPGMNRKRKNVARTTGTTKKLKTPSHQGSKNQGDIFMMNGGHTYIRNSISDETARTGSFPAFVASANRNDSDVGNEDNGVGEKVHIKQNKTKVSVASRGNDKGSAVHGYNLRSSPQDLIKKESLATNDVNMQSDSSLEDGKQKKNNQAEFKVPELPSSTQKELKSLAQNNQYAPSSTKIQPDNTSAGRIIQPDWPMHFGDLSYSNICTTPYPNFDSTSALPAWANFHSETLGSPVVPESFLEHMGLNMVSHCGLDGDFSEARQSAQGVNNYMNSGDILQQFESTMDLGVESYSDESYDIDGDQGYPDLNLDFDLMLPYFVVPLPSELNGGSEPGQGESSNMPATETIEILEPGSMIQHGDSIGSEWLEWKEYEINDAQGRDNPVYIEQDWGKWTENTRGPYGNEKI